MFDSPPVDRAGLERWIAERYPDVPFIAEESHLDEIVDKLEAAIDAAIASD